MKSTALFHCFLQTEFWVTQLKEDRVGLIRIYIPVVIFFQGYLAAEFKMTCLLVPIKAEMFIHSPFLMTMIYLMEERRIINAEPNEKWSLSEF